MKSACVEDFVNRLNFGVVLLVKDARICLTSELSWYKNVSEFALLVSCFGKNVLSEFRLTL
jgi:hypothetical protein